MRHTHGMTGTPEYRTWAGIIQRCCNPKRHDYRRYGGAGVGIDPVWRESFVAFYEHIGPRPSPAHSVDRIDGAKGYVPGNVRWATLETQAQNSSIARPITFGGRTLTASEWARVSGIGFTTIIARMNRGLPPEQILTPDKLVGGGVPAKVLEHQGIAKTISEWAAEIGVTKSVLKKRLKAGVPLARALMNPMPPREGAS